MRSLNAKLNRNVIRWLVAFAALGGVQIASAAYSTLPTPNGYTPGTAAARATYAAAATDKTLQNVIRQAGGTTASVVGNKIKIDVAYKLAPTAARIAARAIFLNPYVAVGVGVASWLVTSNVRWDDITKSWVTDNPDAQPSNGNKYTSSESSILNGVWYDTYQSACGAISGWFSRQNSGGTTSIVSCTDKAVVIRYVAAPYFDRDSGKTVVPNPYNYQYALRDNPSTCQAGWYLTSNSGCVQFPPVITLTEQDFVERVADKPMPSTVPTELPPGTPLPVDRPVVNPSTGDNPSPLPFRVPTGQPQPIPNTNPQQYKQPYVDIIPAPTDDNPFQVDVKPGETTSTDPNPVTNPEPDPNAEDKPTPEEDKSLCEKHPDILACAKPELDTPDGEIPKTTREITYQVDNTFGGGACPANVYSNIGGKNIMVYEWSRTCGVVTTYIKPIILLLSALGALFILIPGRD